MFLSLNQMLYAHATRLAAIVIAGNLVRCYTLPPLKHRLSFLHERRAPFGVVFAAEAFIHYAITQRQIALVIVFGDFAETYFHSFERGGPAQLDRNSGLLSVALRVRPPELLAAK